MKKTSEDRPLKPLEIAQIEYEMTHNSLLDIYDHSEWELSSTLTPIEIEEENLTK